MKADRTAAADWPSAERITAIQSEATDRWHREPIDNVYNGCEGLVCQQHEYNFRLWHEEDKARSPAASDQQIADVKRSIDKLNQARNDAIEQLDDAIAESLVRRGIRATDKPINSETAGSIIDRLSILSLRLFHYGEQQNRREADQAIRELAADRIEICRRQHRDLTGALDQLLDDLLAGRKQHKLYRQLKMYNDPRLNPAIYQAREKQ